MLAGNGLINRLVNLGTRPEYEEYLNEKIKMTNIVCFIYQIAFTTYYFEGVVFESNVENLLLVVVGVLCFVFILNALTFTTLSRLFLFITPLLLSTYYKSVSSAQSGTINYLYGQNEIVILMIPLVVFDTRDKILIIFCLLFEYISATSFPAYYHLFSSSDMDIKPVMIGSGRITVMTGNFIICGALIYSLAYRMVKDQFRNKKLMEQTAASNDLLQKAQENLNEKLLLLERAKIEEQQNSWVAEGLNFVTQHLMQSETSIEVTCDKLISHLVKYMNVNQGALYLVTKSDLNRNLILKSCYAYDRKKFAEHQIGEGDGLLGQVLFEKDQMYLKDIPKNYIKITSGLGESLPRNLLITPLMNKETVEGIIELASFGDFKQHQRKFLMAAGKVIASHFANLQLLSATKKLYDDTHEQTSKLKSQEEEIRQNMEELQAIQEVMIRNEQTYKAKIDELESKLSPSLV